MATTDRTYHIRPVLAGQTLASALRGLIRDLSWEEARRLVAGRQVQVNGNLVLDDARRLKAGDVVKVFASARAPVPTSQDVAVRHLDRDLVVVEKPAGMTTLRHAEERDWPQRRKQRQPTLDEVLQEMLPGLWAERFERGGEREGGPARHPLSRGDDGGKASGKGNDRRQSRPAPSPGKGAHLPARPPGKGMRPLRPVPGKAARHSAPPPAPVKVPRVRPVHRLDRDTSGLMVFALSPQAEQALVDGFKRHAIQRAYRAVVNGKLTEPRTVETWIVRDRGDGLRGSSPRGADDPDAQRAVTHMKPIEHIGEAYTLIECRLETGRTHQIRIHLSELGHMLCGEKVYTRATPDAPPRRDESGAPRHALHSAELEFTHPVTGQAMRFNSGWPKDLAQWLGRLRAPHRPEGGGGDPVR